MWGGKGTVTLGEWWKRYRLGREENELCNENLGSVYRKTSSSKGSDAMESCIRESLTLRADIFCLESDWA